MVFQHLNLKAILMERRSADVNARAVMIAEIATGEPDDATTDDGKNAAAASPPVSSSRQSRLSPQQSCRRRTAT